MLGIGRHTEQLIFSAPERVSNGSGGFETVWTPYLTTQAQYIHKRVSNDLVAQGLNLVEAFEVKIRRRPDVTISIGHKAEWRGKECEILGFPNPDRKDYTTIQLKALSNAI